MRKVPIYPEDTLKIIELRKEGRTLSAIGEIMGVSRQRVFQICQENNIQKPKPLLDPSIVEIVSKYKATSKILPILIRRMPVKRLGKHRFREPPEFIRAEIEKSKQGQIYDFKKEVRQ